MYLIIIVILLLLFITLFQYMSEGPKEGLENSTGSVDVLNEPTILATDTEVQLPNHVIGNRGKHLTFGGDLILENANSLEFGKGIDKGENAGKIRYNDKGLNIYGGGKKDYKINLWDNVEVGGLLEVNDIHFGDAAMIQYNQKDKNFAITGPGKQGERKVKIWDDVEVGRLMASKGMEVPGAFTAYNNEMNVLAPLKATKGMSIFGDLDVSGNINNQALNNRLNQIDSLLKQSTKPAAPTIDPQVVTNLQKSVAGLSNTVQGQISTVSSQVKETKEQVDQLANQEPQSAGADPQALAALQGNVSTLENTLKSSTSQLKSTTDKANQAASTASQATTQCTTQINALTQSFNVSLDKVKAELATMINANLSTELAKTKGELEALSAAKITSMLQNSNGETLDVSKQALNALRSELNSNIQNVSAVANVAAANASAALRDPTMISRLTAIANTANISNLGSFLTNANLTTLANSSIDFTPAGKLADFSKSSLTPALITNFMNNTKLNDVANSTMDFSSKGRLFSLANTSMDLNALGKIAGLNTSALSTISGLDTSALSTIAGLNATKLRSFAESALDFTPTGKLARLSNADINVSSLESLANASSGYSAFKSTTQTNTSTIMTMLNNMSTENNKNASTRAMLDTLNTSFNTLRDDWTGTKPSLATKTSVNASFQAYNTDYLSKFSTINTFNTNLSNDVYNTTNGVLVTGLNNLYANKATTAASIGEIKRDIKSNDDKITATTTNLANNYYNKTQTNASFFPNMGGNLNVPGKMFVGDANKWRLDPLSDKLQVTKNST